jgi:uncharacterized protein (DUF58 family)
MNSKTLTLILIVLGLFLAALVTLRGDLAWMTMPFLAYLGIGILQSPVLGTVKLQAARSVERLGTEAGSFIRVDVAVRNAGADVVDLRLADPLRTGWRVTDGSTQTAAALGTGESAVLRYGFQAGRGNYEWETVRATVSDPLGVIEAGLMLPAAAEVQVRPEWRKYRPFPMLPQRTLHTSGSIPARLGGRGTSFWGVREYHPGDTLRRLDWRRTARHPNRFFSKEFEQEEIADIGLVLDARQMTDMLAGPASLFEHSVGAAASLAEVFLRYGNRVSLLIYGKEITGLFPGYGKRQLNRILRALSRAVPEAETGFNTLQFVPLQMFSNRSLIFIISPLAPDDWRLFPRLRAHGYQALLISPDPIDYARRNLPADPATRLAVRLAQVERRLQIGKITQLWIPVVEWRVDQPLEPLVRTAMRTFRIRQER